MIYNAVLGSRLQQSGSVINMHISILSPPYVITDHGVNLPVIYSMSLLFYVSYDITFMWNLIKMIQKNLFTKQTQTQSFQNQSYGFQRGNGGERYKMGGWD